MRILKNINNNVALARDADGNELIVVGTGVGFPKCPYELEDESKIQRVYRHIDSSLLHAVASISPDALDIALQIAEAAQARLKLTLNPNLPFTLADHIHFSVERFKEGVVITNPLSMEVPYIFAEEYQVGLGGVKLIRERFDVNMPDVEACSIALHLVNAESENGKFSDNMDRVMKFTRIIDEIVDLVAKVLGITIERSSRTCARFVTHLRYLLARLEGGLEPAEIEGASMLRSVKDTFPDAYRCAKSVAALLKRRCGWTCSDEEILYLMMYINRLQTGVN